MDVSEMEHRLGAFVARHVGVEQVAVSGLHKLPGGASREIWSLDAAYEKDRVRVQLPLVLRRDPSSSVVGAPRRDEFDLLRAAAAAGVPVPKVHWFGDDTVLPGGPFFLMDRIEGETLARRLLRDPEYAPARHAMTAQLGRILAAIHRIDRRAHDLSFLSEPGADESPAESELQRYEQIFRTIASDPHPAF